MKEKVYIVIRQTEDWEFNTVDVFQSVHKTPEGADVEVEKLRNDFGFNYDILEREINS